MRYLKILFPIIILLIISFNVFSNWNIVSKSLLDANVSMIILGFAFSLLVYPQGAFSWYKLLTKLKIEVSFPQVLRIWILSSVSRYIPGVVWQYIGRVELAKKNANIDRSQTGASLIFEAYFAILAACLLGVVALFLLPQLYFGRELIWLGALILIFLLHPHVFFKLLTLLAKAFKKDINLDKFKISFIDSLEILFWFILNFIINGLALYFVIRAFYLDFSFFSLVPLISFYSISWLLGFVSFISPGGLGVSELTLAFLLSFWIPFPVASSLALIYRVLLILSELVIFVGILFSKKIWKRIG